MFRVNNSDVTQQISNNTITLTALTENIIDGSSGHRCE